MTEIEIKHRLASKIDNETLNRILKLHPNINTCPTCSGRNRYVLDSVTYECDCELQKLLQKHYFAANIGRAYHTLCFEHFISEDSAEVIPVLKKYIEDWSNNKYYGHGLTFNGPVGTGKTFAASLILKELVKKGVGCFFITFDELVNTFAQAWNNDEAKYLNTKLRSVEILVIDELRTDSRNQNGFLSQAAETIVRHRAVNLLPTIITTNLNAKEEEATFTKTYSLLSALNNRISYKGEDVRGKIVRERDYGMKERNERRPVC
jgi:DNA replication protein DnaC